ncbi:syntaxin-125-like protein [Salvia divinorum]|uniref:Syntaxin-125-like protein n=1 Tax=Salvia divinorum TaxID=28513 RepID=A0ABD1G052_SALDI
MEETSSSKMHAEAEAETVAARRHDSYCLEMFYVEVENMKQDLTSLENLFNSLCESNEDIKKAEDSGTMRGIRARLNDDLDDLFKLAKQINKKYDGLVRANAAQRGSGDDQARAGLISDVVDALHALMRRFQSLRSEMETDHRQIIEAKFFAITREKATPDAIDNLIASGSPLHHASEEHGSDPMAEAVAEIQERRDAMREVRRNLMALHQVLLGIAAPPSAADARPGQDGESKPATGGDAPEASPPPAASAASGGKGGGMGGLNDYEKETRNQAYIAIVIALVIILTLVIATLRVDIALESNPP